MMEKSTPKHFILDTNLSPFRTTRGPGYKFFYQGTICSLWVNVIILDKCAPACSMLLLQRSASDSHSGCWETPGGKVDYDAKTLRKAAEREVEKKTGITGLIFLDTVPIERWDTSEAEGVHGWLNLTFLAIVDGQSGWQESIRSAEEGHQVLKWVTKSDVWEMGKNACYGSPLWTILQVFDFVENAIGVNWRVSSTAAHHDLE
jgi:8-oxo-dGTP pyrophosphatase MutT (NUDIX family)